MAKNLITLEFAEKVTDRGLAIFEVLCEAMAPLAIGGGIGLIVFMLFVILTRQ